MKVWELKKVLDTISQEAEVVLSCDAEGNHISPLVEVDECYYLAENKWDGSILYKEENDSKEGVPAVVLWPVN